MQALAIEISNHAMPAGVLASTSVETVYFGGGTPSLLSTSELGSILQQLQKRFSISPTAEITLEANPDDISNVRLQQWKKLGFNRLSIGVQSFAHADLQWMNRAHTAAQARQCLQMARDNGFFNLSIDLIYGLPQMSLRQWQANIEEALHWQVPHLSCYALTVEDKTALHYFIKKGKVAPMNDASQAEHFLLLMQMLERSGYEHYEISNFSLPGHRSRHNSNYWLGVPYYGFGPAAHSFDGNNTRWWNVANNSLYIGQQTAGLPTFESETLLPHQRINETIMTKLRMAEGLLVLPSANTIEGFKLNTADWKPFWHQVQQAIANEWILYENDTLRLSNEGKLYADHIAAGMFISHA